MDVPDLATLREMLEKAIFECFDLDTLDLVYKIIICGNIQ